MERSCRDANLANTVTNTNTPTRINPMTTTPQIRVVMVGMA